jgi:hypothetical protein
MVKPFMRCDIMQRVLTPEAVEKKLSAMDDDNLYEMMRKWFNQTCAKMANTFRKRPASGAIDRRTTNYDYVPTQHGSQSIGGRWRRTRLHYGVKSQLRTEVTG